MHERLPAIFLGHGNPMNALLDNGYTRGGGASESRRGAQGILSISAHWFVRQPA